MKRLLLLSPLVLASLSSAEPPAKPTPTQATPEEVVKTQLLQPLFAKESQQSRFSRARLPPLERRVRITDAQARTDAAGAAFFAFEVDSKHGDWDDDENNPWKKATIVGCVYPEKKEVFVKSGNAYRPAAFLTGKKVQPADASVCQPATVAKAR